MKRERPIRHGTTYSYYRRGCRCPLCLEARRQMSEQATARRRAARDELPASQVAEAPRELRIRRSVLLACSHEVVFGECAPRRNEIIWCVRCADFCRVVRGARKLQEVA